MIEEPPAKAMERYFAQHGLTDEAMRREREEKLRKRRRLAPSTIALIVFEIAAVIAILVWWLAPARAETITGRAIVVDGDGLDFGGGRRVRIYGIDAPERNQLCRRADGSLYPAGRMAAEALAARIGNEIVHCSGDQDDRYGRSLMTCEVAGQDLGEWLVASGHAFAYRHFTPIYVDEEAAARRSQRGIWAGYCDAPYQWRRNSRQ